MIVNTICPRFLCHRLLLVKTPCLGVQKVEEPVSVGLREKVLLFARDNCIQQYHNFGGVPVEDIVRRELKIPSERATIRVQRDDAIRVEIVAGTCIAVKIGTRIADRPIDKICVRIERARQPRRATACLLGISGPCFCAGFS